MSDTKRKATCWINCSVNVKGASPIKLQTGIPLSLSGRDQDIEAFLRANPDAVITLTGKAYFTDTVKVPQEVVLETA